MKKKLFDLKSMITGITIGALLFGGVVTASTLVSEVYLSPFPVYVNGNKYNPTSPMLNYQGKTYVPLSEFGSLTNSNVSFNNNTVFINSNDYNSYYNYPSYSQTNSRDDMEIEVGEKDTFYVNLNKYGAKSASISYNTSYLKLSQSYLYYSGTVTVEGKKEGDAVIKITYNTGNVDYIDVTVTDDEYDDEIELEVGDTETISIDLDDYDASKATLTYDSDYISLSKTKLTKSGKVTITAKKEGETTIKIKYSTGDTDYIEVIIEDDDDYEDEIELEVGESDTIYIDLDDYDADKATLTYDSDYISLSKTKLTKSGKVTVTAKNEGETTIKIKYDTGDTEYINVTIDGDSETYSREISFSKSGNLALDINLDVFDAKSATISYESSYVSLSKTSLSKSEKITVTPKKTGTTELKIKYNTGDIEYIKLKIF